MKFFSKLFNKNKSKPKPTKAKVKVISQKTINPNPTSDIIPEIIIRYRKGYKDQSLTELNDLYFNLLEQLIESKKKGDIDKLLMFSQGSLGLIEPLIQFNKNEYGHFDITSIPAIDNALIYFAIYGSTGQLKNIQDIVDYFDELHFYKDKVDLAFKRRKLAAKIYQYVKAHPNCPQKTLKYNVDCDDGRFISTTVHYMDKAGKLTRRKDKNNTFLTIT